VGFVLRFLPMLEIVPSNTPIKKSFYAANKWQLLFYDGVTAISLLRPHRKRLFGVEDYMKYNYNKP